jgi:hypothetical protein
MYIDKELREEMKALSKELLGTSSKWEKIVRDGILVPRTKMEKIIVPGKDGQPDTENEIKVLALNEQKQKVYDTKYLTAEELLDELRKIKSEKTKMEEERKRQQELAKRQKDIQDIAGGTAVI